MCKSTGASSNLVEVPETVSVKRCISLMSKIIKDQTHPLYPYITTLPHGRLRMLKYKTDRFHKTFLPYTIKLYNVK